MRTNKMILLLTVALLAATISTADVALAQRGGMGGKPPIEFAFTYGSMWGGNLGLSTGKLRTGTGGSMGFTLDVPVAPGTWAEASYTRQDGSLDWDPNRASKITLTDMTVNVWHLGTIRALHQGGPMIPFVQGSLGATYMSPSTGSITIDGEDYAIDSVTKFSIAFGAGFKAYFGEAQKVGIRASFKVISTLYDSGGGVFFGPGGVQLGVSGSGIWQYEAAGGLTVRFGG